MPTVIDSLVVELGLDPSKFTEGEKATIATLGKTQRALKQMADDAEAQAKRARTSASATSQKASADKKASIADSKTDAKQSVSDAKAKQQAEYQRIAEKKKANADAAKAERDARRKRQEELRKAQKEREEGVKKTGELFKSAKNEALAFIAVAIGAKGIEAFARDSVVQNAGLGRSAANIGVDVPDLSAYRNMVQRNGGSPEAVTASLQGLTDQMEQLKVTGNNAILPFLQMIPGVSAASKATDIVKAFVGWANQHRNDRPLVNLVGKSLGLDQGLINEALKGSTQFMKDFGDAQKAAANPEQTRRAAELQSSWEKLGQSLGKVGDKVLYDFEPVVKETMDTVSDFADKSPGWTAAIVGGLSALTGAAMLGKLVGLLRILGLVKTAAVETEAAASAGILGRILGRLGILGAGIAAADILTSPSLPAEDNPDIVAANPGLKSSPRSGPELDNPTGQWDWRGMKDRLKRKLFGASDKQTNADIDFYKSKGWTAAQAAGIVANIQAESGGDPGAFNPAGGGQGAFGLGQWRGPRIDALKAFAASRGKNYTDRQTQLEFYDHELRNGQGGAQLSGASTAQDASAAVLKYFERPAPQDLAADSFERGRRAEYYLNKYSLTGPAPDPALDIGASTAAGRVSNDNRSSSTSTSDTKIGSIVIQTQATDAQGIMRDAAGAARSSFASQANSGMT